MTEAGSPGGSGLAGTPGAEAGSPGDSGLAGTPSAEAGSPGGSGLAGTPGAEAGSPGGSGLAGRPGSAGGHGSGDPWHELIKLADEVAARRAAVLPAWRRRTQAETRWPVTLTVIGALALQLLLPGRLALRPVWLLPVLEGALFIGLVVANPVRFERRSAAVRTASVVLIFLVTGANAVSAARLVADIVLNKGVHTAVPLLTAGASVWATNVIAFALWYWEFDRGGPVHRSLGYAVLPDLMFPQMSSPELAPPDWSTRFVDYLYLSFTNATAFSPTDVMPLARWAKFTMLVQSAVSLALGALVIARAINILG
jgi:uncharacterized membrane protein